jgi:adenosylcobinamide-GDP ribazoletransferase
MMARAIALRLPALRAQAQVALMLLTRLPAGQLPRGQDVPSMGQTVWAFPLVGALLGGMCAGVLVAARWLGLPAELAAGLALITLVLASGGLHEDGLADVADGFGGGRDVAHKLEIMRDSRIGSYGTLALIFAIGLRWLCLTDLAQGDALAAIGAVVAIEACARAGLGVMLHAMPSARRDGLGRAAAALVPRAAVVAGAAVAAVLAWLGFGPAALWILAALCAAQAGFCALALRQIGGQTGDVLGAAQQIGAIAGYITATALAA